MAPAHYDYQIFFDHRDTSGKTLDMEVYEGHHDGTFQPTSNELVLSLVDLKPDPDKPDQIRVCMRLLEREEPASSS